MKNNARPSADAARWKGVLCMPITISYNNGSISVSSEVSRRGESVVLSDLEAAAVQLIESAIGSSIRVERRSSDYLSLIAPNGIDFCRLKIGNRSMWFSLDLWQCAAVKSDPRLAAVKNKNQRHWKISIQSVSDIVNYSDIISSAYDYASRVVMP